MRIAQPFGRPRPELKKQQGMVLLLAMMIVVLVTSLVVATSWRFELGMSRNENRWHGLQARLVLDGGEKLAAKLFLLEDLRDETIDGSEEVDNKQEMWMSPFSEGIDGGTITVQMEDAQARFNINLLAPVPVVPGQQPRGANGASSSSGASNKSQECNDDPQLFHCAYTVSQRRFIRYLQTLPMNEQPITPFQAQEIVNALIDWMDGDHEPKNGGAEQSYYSGLEVPIVVSNAPMTTISELSLVKGITPEIYERLLPNVIALPTSEKSPAYPNINTMPDAMLRMFNLKSEMLPLDEGQASDLIFARNETVNPNIQPAQGYQNIDDFVTNLTDLGLNKADLDSSELSVGTNYFIYNGEVIIGDKTRRIKTLMRRDRNKSSVEVLWRTDANF
ncbi:type II secretion system minor pseudopilin GspK [Marinagarivorans algicola]|uniref:type II secretion system minor pseudopilin GspK n=1 Tax=Marinagarivorans algicola TaxID=1513270 RepID=UPI0006B9BF41|nr:type II secretion system minor pseudopilin GspK [Marinagarivorans algicola]